MGNYNDAINRIVDLADQQINQGMSSLHTEIDNWERRRQTLLTSVEQEINRLSNKYTEEIVQVTLDCNPTGKHRLFRGENGLKPKEIGYMPNNKPSKRNKLEFLAK